MEEKDGTREIKIYSYRWVVLLVFMLASLAMQIFWICYAPITGLAAERYGVSDQQIGLLAMLFMYVYIPLAIPASWMIDTWGFKKSVALGAVLMGIFGLVRGILTQDYTMALIATIGISAAQPLFLNSGTKLAANWFPLNERATVIGIGSVAPLLGIVIGQMATPGMVESFGFETTMLIYGVVGAVAAVLFVVFAKDHPPTPAGYEERVLMLDGLKHILKLKEFYMLAFIVFVVNAIFNGVSTWVEPIVRPKGMDFSQAGTIGGLLMIGGILGLFVFPPISDKLSKRKPVFLAGIIGSIPFLVAMTLLDNFALMAVASALLGFFIMGITPVAYQYGTEKLYPAPEGTSMGLIILSGQISVVVISIMGWMYAQLGDFNLSLLILAGLMVVSAILLSLMKESEMVQQAQVPSYSPTQPGD